MPRHSASALLLGALVSCVAHGCTAPLQMATFRPVQPQPLVDHARQARLVHLAEQYAKQGNPEGAERLYKYVLKTQPDNAEAQRGLASLADRPRTGAPQATSLAAAPTRNAVPETHRLASATTTRTPAEAAAGPAPSAAELAARPAAVPPARSGETSAWAEEADPLGPLAGLVAQHASTIATPPTVAAVASRSSDAEGAWWNQPSAPRTADGASPPEKVARHRGVSRSEGPGAGAPSSDPAHLPDWAGTSLLRLCSDVPEEIRPLLVQLESRDANVRKDGLVALAARGPEARSAVCAVRALLTDGNPLVQAHAAWALWNVTRASQDAVPPLAALLASPREDVVQLAAYVLGTMGREAGSAVVALRLVRDGASDATRVHAAEALVRIDPDDEASVRVLLASLKQGSNEVRWLSAIALGGVSRAHATEAVAALSAALEDPHPEVCSAAALSLGGLGGVAQSAVPRLRRIADHRQEDVRQAARTALACIER